MKIIFVLSVLLLFLAVTIGCRRAHPHGCSRWGIGQWENTFPSSCDRQEMCYICGGGGHQHWSQEECDRAFLANMRKACSKVRKRHRFSWPRKECNFWATRYYNAAKNFGSWSYHRDYCKESCIPTHGDPNRMISL